MLSSLPILAAAAVEHGESAGGIMEIVHGLGLNVPSFVAQMLNFSIVAFIIYRFGIKPVLATIDERKTKIADGLRYTEEMKARLAETEKQHAETLRKAALEAQRIIDESRAAAKELLERETKEATARAQQLLAKADEAIVLERNKMLASVREEISRLVVLTSSRVLRRELDSDERRRYAESAARELSGV
jgi:F-type H+-transporting ATPase subunit b